MPDDSSHVSPTYPGKRELGRGRGVDGVTRASRRGPEYVAAVVAAARSDEEQAASRGLPAVVGVVRVGLVV